MLIHLSNVCCFKIIRLKSVCWLLEICIEHSSFVRHLLRIKSPAPTIWADIFQVKSFRFRDAKLNYVIGKKENLLKWRRWRKKESFAISSSNDRKEINNIINFIFFFLISGQVKHQKNSNECYRKNLGTNCYNERFNPR